MGFVWDCRLARCTACRCHIALCWRSKRLAHCDIGSLKLRTRVIPGRAAITLVLGLMLASNAPAQMCASLVIIGSVAEERLPIRELTGIATVDGLTSSLGIQRVTTAESRDG